MSATIDIHKEKHRLISAGLDLDSANRLIGGLMSSGSIEEIDAITRNLELDKLYREVGI
jgi:hypothetical protein